MRGHVGRASRRANRFASRRTAVPAHARRRVACARAACTFSWLADTTDHRGVTTKKHLPVSTVYISSLQAGKDCLDLVRAAIAIDYVVTIDARTAMSANVCGYADFSDTGIPLRHVHRYSMNDPRDVEMIASLDPQLIIVNGWNRLIPSSILGIARACVGFHGSWKPLPFGRGRSPVTWALMRGETQFFLHLLHLDDGVDSGDIIDTMRFDIAPLDTCATLLNKVGTASAQLLIENVAAILDGTAARTRQSGEPTYLPKVPPSIGRIDWTATMHEIRNLVRATTRPYRGAWCEIDYRGDRVTMRVWEIAPFAPETQPALPTGVVVQELDGKPLIRCSDGLMLISDFTVAPQVPR
jgi:methionyl-tRNA formyltransferase